MLTCGALGFVDSWIRRFVDSWTRGFVSGWILADSWANELSGKGRLDARRLESANDPRIDKSERLLHEVMATSWLLHLVKDAESLLTDGYKILKYSAWLLANLATEYSPNQCFALNGSWRSIRYPEKSILNTCVSYGPGGSPDQLGTKLAS